MPALAKRQAAKEAGEGEAVIEEPTLDIEQVNDQSMRLIRLALLGGFIAALYWVWSDLISVFSYLDNVTLYEYTSGTGANVSMVPISIGDLLGALIIIGITFALARNLPACWKCWCCPAWNWPRAAPMPPPLCCPM
jgi:potassium efflux system protein